MYFNIYLKSHGFSILKCMCRPQWSLGKHCVLVTFSIPTKPKWTGTTLFGCECRMYARSNRKRGLNLPGNSLLQFRTISHVYWHSLREPHEIHRSSIPGGMPPARSSCKIKTNKNGGLTVTQTDVVTIPLTCFGPDRQSSGDLWGLYKWQWNIYKNYTDSINLSVELGWIQLNIIYTMNFKKRYMYIKFKKLKIKHC